MTRAGAALLLLLAACAGLPRAPVPDPEQGAWPVVRDANTRRVKLYDGLATNAFAAAVWEGPEVRAARIERTAAWKAMTAQERAALEASEAAAAAKFEEFTVSLFTADPNDNDLDAPRPGWRIALVTAAGELLPVRVEQLRADALVRTLYPLVGDFDVVYRVRFARREEAPMAPPFTLRIAGARGQMDFPFAVARTR